MDIAVNRELLEKVRFDVLKVSGLAKALMSYSLSEDEKKVVEMILAGSRDAIDRLREVTR